MKENQCTRSQPEASWPQRRFAFNGAAIDSAAFNGTAIDGAAFNGYAISGAPFKGAVIDGAVINGTSGNSRHRIERRCHLRAAFNGAATDGDVTFADC